MNFDMRLTVKETIDGVNWATGTWYDMPSSFDRALPFCEKLTASSNHMPCQLGWWPFHGSCYRILKWLANYAKAIESCANQEAHLVSIHSPEEQEFVRSLCGDRMPGPRLCSI